MKQGHSDTATQRHIDQLQSQLDHARADLCEMRQALEFYADKKKWTQCESTSDINWPDGATAYDGEPFMAFSDGRDSPWNIAKDALSQPNPGAELLKDKERLDWLENQSSGFRLHDTAKLGALATIRQAIDAARFQSLIIEHKLLTALEDSGTVAALLSKQDLEDLIAALYGYDIATRKGNVLSRKAHLERKRELAKSFEQLLREAFPKSERRRKG